MQSTSSGNRSNAAAAAAEAAAYIFVFLLPCTRTLRFSCPEVDGKRKEEDVYRESIDKPMECATIYTVNTSSRDDRVT